MKMNFIFGSLLLASSLCLAGCGDDNEPQIPAMGKVTAITCTETGTSNTWTMRIDYEPNADNLYKVFYSRTGNVQEEYSEVYQFAGNSATVTRFIGTDPNTDRVYTLSGSAITREEIGPMASTANNSTYTYSYIGRELTAIQQTIPESTPLPYDFKWDKTGNMIEFTYNNVTRLHFDYSGKDLHPENFPLKAAKSPDLTDKSFIDPINLLLNATSRYLPVRAEESELGVGNNVGNNRLVKSYTFQYNWVGNYVTKMTMTVKDASDATRTFVYTFAYDYTPGSGR